MSFIEKGTACRGGATCALKTLVALSLEGIKDFIKTFWYSIASIDAGDLSCTVPSTVCSRHCCPSLSVSVLGPTRPRTLYGSRTVLFVKRGSKPLFGTHSLGGVVISRLYLCSLPNVPHSYTVLF